MALGLVGGPQNPTIRSPDWSKDLAVQDDPYHDLEKTLGGEGIVTLATLGAGQLGKLARVPSWLARAAEVEGAAEAEAATGERLAAEIAAQTTGAQGEAAAIDGAGEALAEIAPALEQSAPRGLSSLSNMNRVAGRLYDQNRLDAMWRYLDRNNVDLILNSTENKFVANSIGRHQLHLRPGPTFYEVYHELQHYRHLGGVGYARFSRTSEALREQYVYDQLRLGTNLWRNVLNQAERDNAFLYILLNGGNPMSTPVRGFPQAHLKCCTAGPWPGWILLREVHHDERRSGQEGCRVCSGRRLGGWAGG